MPLNIGGTNITSVGVKVLNDTSPLTGSILYVDAGIANSYPGSGTTWTDLSGYGNNGTLVNGPTFNTGSGGYILFDGTDDYVSCGNSSSLDLTRTISMEQWFYVNTLPGSWTNVYGKMNANGDTPTRSYTAFINNAGYIHLCSADTSGQETLNSTSFIGVGIWWHWVGTIDRNAGTMVQYVNGVQNVAGSVRTTDAVVTTDPVRLGYEGTVYAKYNGRVAAARLYSRILSAQEVLQNFQSQRQRFGV